MVNSRHPVSSRRRTVWVLLLTCGLAAPSPADPPVRIDATGIAGPPAPPAPDEAPGSRLVRVPTFLGHELFWVLDPDAAVSAAWRENSDLIGHDGIRPPPTSGWSFTDGLIVRGDDAELVRNILRATLLVRAEDPARATVQPLEGAPGFLLAHAGSVGAAFDAAEACRADARIAEAYMDAVEPRSLRSPPTDPGYPSQWHLNNVTYPLTDINVESVWDSGITGAGVVVGIAEFGFTTSHPDLAANYSAANSQAGGGATSHGSSTAGLVGAVRDNGLGGVGVAYGGRISKLYVSTTVPSTNVTAFGFRNDTNMGDGVDENWIKTNSWGPSDNAVIDRFTSAEAAALATAVGTGRGGRGEVFVWAGGNGALASGGGDRVDYDPYASSRFVIAIGALNFDDRRSRYSEIGSSLLVMAPSDDDLLTTSDVGIYTTSGTNTYTSTFGGTSAASPIAAGVIALMLDADPTLTWRDIKHILVRSARRCDPAAASWETNGAGRAINYNYGFGAIDAAAAVGLVQGWPKVGPEESLVVGPDTVGLQIPDTDPAGLTRTLSIPTRFRTESVEIVLNIAHTNIGDLRITLTSPSGTRSVFATPRSDPTDNYPAQIFHSVRFWDEDARGTWTLQVADESAGTVGAWNDWSLRIYGVTPPCQADWNGADGLDSQDYFDFLESFFAGDADFNGVDGTDSQDFFDFLEAFFEGC